MYLLWMNPSVSWHHLCCNEDTSLWLYSDDQTLLTLKMKVYFLSQNPQNHHVESLMWKLKLEETCKNHVNIFNILSLEAKLKYRKHAKSSCVIILVAFKLQLSKNSLLGWFIRHTLQATYVS